MATHEEMLENMSGTVVADKKGEFNSAFVVANQHGGIDLQVFPSSEGAFEPFQVPIKPPTPDEIQKALERPQVYGAESARVLLSDLLLQDLNDLDQLPVVATDKA